MSSLDAEVRTRVEERGLSGAVDRVKVERVTKDQTGIAKDVTP